MGLCKCPKRKVTNLFCFEHRVNVCEHCLVSNHPNCVVQSYLNWLQDSDYRPICTLCNERLDDERYGQCVRLVCYDVFHWSCLNRYAVSLPATTAPAGYQCTNCKAAIFPPVNLVSPVAERLKDLLSKVNWARAGLGLPLIDKQEIPVEPVISSTTTVTLNSSAGRITPSGSDSQLGKPVQPVQPTVQQGGYTSASSSYTQPYSRASEPVGSSGKSSLPSHSGSHVLNMSDHDTDKYKRRSAFHFLAQWFKTHNIGTNLGSKSISTQKRFFIILGIGVIGFLTVLVIFSRLSQDLNGADDTLKDMMDNANIRVADGENQGA